MVRNVSNANLSSMKKFEEKNLKMANSREFQLKSLKEKEHLQNEVELFSCSSCHEWQIKQLGDDLTVSFTSNPRVFFSCRLFQWIFAAIFEVTFFPKTMKPFFWSWNHRGKNWCKRKRREITHPRKKNSQQARGTLATLAPPLLQLHSPYTSTIAASSSASLFFKLSIEFFYLIIHFMSFAFSFFLFSRFSPRQKV